MKIVLDTNVLVSGLLKPFGSSGEIIRMVSSGQLALCYDSRILTEYREVLLRTRFQFNPDHIGALLEYIQYVGQVYPTLPLTNPLPDPDDEPFLEVAIAGNVSCLVTGNKVHFPKSHLQGVLVFSPTDFLKYYREEKDDTEQG